MQDAHPSRLMLMAVPGIRQIPHGDRHLTELVVLLRNLHLDHTVVAVGPFLALPRVLDHVRQLAVVDGQELAVMRPVAPVAPEVVPAAIVPAESAADFGVQLAVPVADPRAPAVVAVQPDLEESFRRAHDSVGHRELV